MRFSNDGEIMAYATRDKLSNEMLAYAAGLFDGEGTVGIKRDIRICQSGELRTQFSLSISLSNTHYGAIRWLATHFGGGVTNIKPVSGCKRAWMWYLTSDRASCFLVDLLPYLVIKKEQARYGIFLSMSLRVSAIRRGRVSDYEMLHRHSLRAGLMNANKERLQESIVTPMAV